MTRHAEDLEVGASCELGSYAITRSEIVDFAEKWDPRSFHVTSGTTDADYFHDVIASGAHTLAIFQRLSVLNNELDWAMIAGVGMREVRFLSPVYPEAVLSARSEIVSIAFEPERNRALVTKHGMMFDDERQVLDLVADAYVHMRGARA